MNMKNKNNENDLSSKKTLSYHCLWPFFSETFFLVLYKKSWYQFKFLLQDLVLMTKRAGLLFFFWEEDEEEKKKPKKNSHTHLKKKKSLLTWFGTNNHKKKTKKREISTASTASSSLLLFPPLTPVEAVEGIVPFTAAPVEEGMVKMKTLGGEKKKIVTTQKRLPRWLRWFYQTFQTIIHSYLVPRALWIFLVGLVKLDLVFLEEKIALLEHGLCVHPTTTFSKKTDKKQKKKEAATETIIKGDEDHDSLFFWASPDSTGTWFLLPTLARYFQFLEEGEHMYTRRIDRLGEKTKKKEKTVVKEGWWRIARFWANEVQHSPHPLSSIVKSPFFPAWQHNTSSLAGEDGFPFPMVEGERENQAVILYWAFFFRWGHRVNNAKKKSICNSCEGLAYFYWQGLLKFTWVYFQPFYRGGKQRLHSFVQKRLFENNLEIHRGVLPGEGERMRSVLPTLFFSGFFFFSPRFFSNTLSQLQQLPPQKKTMVRRSEVFFSRTTALREEELCRLARSLLLFRSLPSRLEKRGEEVDENKEKEKSKKKKNQQSTLDPFLSSSGMSMSVGLFSLRKENKTKQGPVLPFFFSSRMLDFSASRGALWCRKTCAPVTGLFVGEGKKKESFFIPVPDFPPRTTDGWTENPGTEMKVRSGPLCFSPQPQDAAGDPISICFDPSLEKKEDILLCRRLPTVLILDQSSRPGGGNGWGHVFAFFSYTKHCQNQQDRCDWFSRILLERNTTRGASIQIWERENQNGKKHSFLGVTCIVPVALVIPKFSGEKKWTRLNFWRKFKTILSWGGVKVFFPYEQDFLGFPSLFSAAAALAGYAERIRNHTWVPEKKMKQKIGIGGEDDDFLKRKPPGFSTGFSF
jgi:hypothetical protein